MQTKSVKPDRHLCTNCITEFASVLMLVEHSQTQDCIIIFNYSLFMKVIIICIDYTPLLVPFSSS